MSADNGITIYRKKLEAYYWFGSGKGRLIAKGKTLDELVDNVQKWIKEQEKDWGYFEIEYGINFVD